MRGLVNRGLAYSNRAIPQIEQQISFSALPGNYKKDEYKIP